MGHKMQLICATAMIKNSFDEMMQQVWEEFPNQKIGRIAEVANGRVDLVLPNYLKVSKSEKYSKFFIKVNQYMLEDIKAKAF